MSSEEAQTAGFLTAIIIVAIILSFANRGNNE